MSLIVWSGTRNCSCTQIWEQSIPSLSVQQQRIRTGRIKVSAWFWGGAHMLLQCPTFLPTCLPTYLLETTWQNNLEIHFSLVSRNWTGFWLPLIMRTSIAVCAHSEVRVPVTPHQSSALVKVTRTAPSVPDTPQRQAIYHLWKAHIPWEMGSRVNQNSTGVTLREIVWKQL